MADFCFDDSSVVIFDLDGTLADTKWRRHYLESDKRDWHAFFEAMGDDKVNEPVATLYRTIWDSHKFQMYIVSGRPAVYQKVTELWLTFNNIQFHRLYMRSEGEQRPDDQIKEEMLREIRSEGKTILFTVDDRKSIVAMWRRNDITCLQVADGDF